MVFPMLLLVTASDADTDSVEDQASYFLKHAGDNASVKCGTPQLIKLLLEDTGVETTFKPAVYERLARPDMPYYADSQEGHFRIHYEREGNNAPDLTDNDNNNIPDFADSALVYLEMAWEMIVVDLGYGKPISDGTRGGGIDLIDCYFQDLTNRPQPLYGYTSPDANHSGSVSSYLVLDNDFSGGSYPTNGYDALKITSAHEFFHVVHYTYLGVTESIWWMEHSAVWFEDYAWDDINDYLNYVSTIYSNRDLPLDTQNGSFEYGASLFAFYIAKNYGTDYIRHIWNAFKNTQSGKIETLNTVLPDGLSDAISDLAVWMYFTNERADSENFFTDAELIDESVEPERVMTYNSSVDSINFHQYTFNYVDIVPKNGFAYGDSIHFHFTDRNNGLWDDKVILYNSPDNYKIMNVSALNPSVFVERPFDKAVLVIANVSDQNKTFRYVYSYDITTSNGVNEKTIPVPLALHQNYPNPFNTSTTISWSLLNSGDISLKVYNLQGQVVQTLEDGFMTSGIYYRMFDAGDLSSGVYFIVLESDGMTLKSRMTYVK
ncbi:hypothetical protein ES708_02871 [subsurface metagenome]